MISETIDVNKDCELGSDKDLLFRFQMVMNKPSLKSSNATDTWFEVFVIAY